MLKTFLVGLSIFVAPLFAETQPAPMVKYDCHSTLAINHGLNVSIIDFGATRFASVIDINAPGKEFQPKSKGLFQLGEKFLGGTGTEYFAKDFDFILDTGSKSAEMKYKSPDGDAYAETLDCNLK